MAIKTGAGLIESLRKVKSVFYIGGEKVDNFVDHPIIKASLKSICLNYDLAHDPEYAELLTADSPLTREKVHLLVNIPTGPEDLVKRIEAVRLLQQKSGGTCTQRNVDPLVPAYSITYDIDQALGTEYHERYKEWLRHVQKNDLMINFSITDPKGDRTLRPHEQSDPDMYLRIVEKRKDGIVVRGAKCHQTNGIASHEKLIFPTRTMTEKDKDYVVAFAIPSDTKGIVHISARLPSDTRRYEGGIDQGNPFGSHTCTIFYNDVFVPWERVFMCGEYQFSPELLKRFGDHHRATYGGCNAGKADVMIGVTATLAEYNGLDNNSIIRDKISEMVSSAETMFACGLAAAYRGYKTESGAYHPNTVLANVSKINISRFPYEIARIATDIAGGLLFTLPSEKDFRNPDLHENFMKYFKGAKNASAEERLRMFSLLQSMIFGCNAVDLHASCPSAAGSFQAARLQINRVVDLKGKKRAAKIIAGVEG